MNVLYEESGDFKVGTVLATSDASLQVEAPHGKRSKVKSNAVLLRFDSPGASELLQNAEAVAADVDTNFLWECSGQDEFGFTDLAREYVGHDPSPVEAAGILLKLHSAPIYFHRKGKGRFRAAPADTLKMALAGLEKKRLLQERIDRWAAELEARRLPDELRTILPELLYKPDRNKAETKALEAAAERTGLAPAKLLAESGALKSTRDYHLGKFLFEQFPHGIGFPRNAVQQDDAAHTARLAELPLAEVAAFSLDDATTTEIDDAFSLTELGDGVSRVGIHIAAPGLGFGPESDLGRVARTRLSTVYFPGDKITMLPPEVIEGFSLAAGKTHPALSLYVDFAADGSILNRHSAIERVPVAANLRHQNTEALDAAFEADPSGAAIPNVLYAKELFRLWRFSEALEAGRGKQQNGPERAEYNFYVEDEHVDIAVRRRGQPLDKLVAEFMILANSTWGKLLDDNGVAAIYRVQGGGKVRMTTGAAAHVGLGVSHYAWSSSPLRRYVDLINQWQLLALVAGESAPFAGNSAELLSAVSDFEATYSAYDEFQRRMESYWCLRWIEQEKVELLTARVLRDNLVRLDRLPMVLRVASLPELNPAQAVELKVATLDFWEPELKCQFVRVLADPE